MSRLIGGGAGSCSDGLGFFEGLRLVGDPVDVVSGAQTFFETDFRLRGNHIPLSWVRHYDSRRHQIDRGIGPGFWLSFDVELRFDLDGITFVNGRGDTIEYPFPTKDGTRIIRAGHELERLGLYHYRVHPPSGGPSLEFIFKNDVVARPSHLFFQHAAADGSQRFPLRLRYEKGVLLAIQVDARQRVVFEYAEQHLTGAVLLRNDDSTKQRLARYEYDQKHRLVQVVDAYGGVLRYEYDNNNRLARATDRRGYSFFHEYDKDGQCVHTRGEDGVEEYRFDYRRAEHLTVATRADGAVTRYHYDDQNNVIQVIDPCGGLTAYLKDGAGRVVAEIDPKGNKSELLYDERDQPYAKRDPLGHVRALPADPRPHPLSHWLPESPLEWEQGTWTGRPPEIPAGLSLAQWLPGWLPATHGPNLSPAPGRSQIVYDVQGLAIKEQREDGRTRRWALDHNGYFRWRTDFDGHTRRFEYGSWNHLLREIDPCNGVTEYTYTISEKVASILDPGGTRSQYDYDAKDRLIRIVRHGKIREQYSYDGADNLLEKRDGKDRPLLTFIIGPGNVTMQRRLASGDVQNFENTPDGRMAAATNRAGTATFAYSPMGRRIVDERDGLGVRHRFMVDLLVETTVLGRFVTKYLRVNGAVTVMLDPGGRTQRIRMAGPGMVERCDSNDTKELAHYDKKGRCLLKIAEGPGLGGPDSGWVRRFVYSAEGDLLRREDSLAGDTTHEHDEAHRLARTRHHNGREESYAYDRAGNLLTAPGLQVHLQSGNRLAQANGDLFEYDDRDHVAGRQGPSGQHRYYYDSRDLLIGIEGPGLSYEAVHDSLGRRVRKIVNGRTWIYYWDSDRLAAEIFPDGGLRVYVYPDSRAMVPMLFLDYDSAEAPPESGRRYHLHCDHLGCPELVRDNTGRTVWKARIDPYGTAHVEVGRDFHQPLRWPGHYCDIETGLHDNRFRTYSPELGRYLQCDPAGTEGGINLYAYTDNPLRTVDLRGNSQSCPDHVEDCPFRKEDGEDAEGVAPKKPLSEMTPDELKAHCEEKAAALKKAHADADPEGEKSTTLSVGVVEGPDGRKLVVTTSADSQELHPKVAEAAKEHGIEPRATEPTIARGPRRDNPDHDPAAAAQRAADGKNSDTRNNPKTVTDPVTVNKETGETTPYPKANNGDPPEGTVHHAEQRMEQGAQDNGENVLAQAPTKECCPGCQKNLGPEGLSKIPDSLQGTPKP